MKLFEYQAKDVFRRYGLQVPQGKVAKSPDEAVAAAEKLGYPCALKAQVLMGGRGKAGLVKLARNGQQARDYARDIFASSVTKVGSVLVEEGVAFEKELYLSITADPVSAQGLVIACAEGGVDIEVLAAERPEALVKLEFDVTQGLMDYQIRNLMYDMGLEGEVAKQTSALLGNLHRIFRDYDAELVEINPVFITNDGVVVAGDGKLSIDDNAAFRQKEFPLIRDYFSSDMEFESAQKGIPYLQFDGDISLMCAGAGLTTTVYDLVNYEGGKVANYLEFGGPNYTRALEAMELCLRNPSKVILIVTFGTIARADVMAQGIVDAIQKLKPNRPIVTCIRGTNEEAAVEILRSAGLTPIFDTEEAVRAAVALASKGPTP